MKTLSLFLTCITFFYSLNVLSQLKVCKSKEEIITDINDLGINKCKIVEKKKVNRIVNFSIKKRNKRFRKINSNKKSISSINSTNSYNLTLKKSIPNIKLPSHEKAILFNLVEEVPLFNGCKRTSKKESIKCFKTKLNKHIEKYFHPEELTDETINEKILIQFTININGKITSIKTNSKSNNKLIYKQLINTLKKTPDFTPGKEQGFPVNVTYSFPLNLTLI